MINKIILLSNPFFDAYTHSDILGKLIFISLISLSIISWIILIHKTFLTYRVRKFAEQFRTSFSNQKMNPLSLEFVQQHTNPFYELFRILKKYTLDLLAKNRRFGGGDVSYLSPTDVDFIQAHLMTTVAGQTKWLEKHLFILATVVSLAPFLGLLGTVWGILITFADMQSAAGSNQVLGGISLALATTVLGLIDAIPALIGYNYLKNTIRDFETDMEGFSNEILASVEMQYRKVE